MATFGAEAITIDVSAQLPPLKGEARSLLSPGHGQAPRVQALLRAAHDAKTQEGFGAAVGDATNALGGVGDCLQARRVNLDLTYLGALAGAFLYEDDAQIREVIYREESGALGYRLRFWVIERVVEVAMHGSTLDG